MVKVAAWATEAPDDSRMPGGRDHGREYRRDRTKPSLPEPVHAPSASTLARRLRL